MSQPPDPAAEAVGIREWLAHKGYPFESRVCDLFRAARFKVVQAARYGDPESGKSRDVDVIAWRSEWLDQQVVQLSVSYVLECKVIHEATPWVLLTQKTPAYYQTNRFGSLFASSIGRDVLTGLKLTSSSPRPPLLQVVEKVGYALIEGPAFAGAQVPKGRALPEEAILQVTSASEARAAFADTIHGDPEEFADIVIPTIVIQGRLFAAEIQEGEIGVVTPVDRGLLLLRTSPDEGWFRLVCIVTWAGLPSFIEDATATADRILDWGDEALTQHHREARRRARS